MNSQNSACMSFSESVKKKSILFSPFHKQKISHYKLLKCLFLNSDPKLTFNNSVNTFINPFSLMPFCHCKFLKPCHETSWSIPTLKFLIGREREKSP